MRPGAPALALLACALAVPAAAQDPASSCVICHADAEVFGVEAVARLERVRAGAHAEVGFSCHDCHGGNPDPALAGDAEAAMDPDFETSPFVGAPARAEVPAFCGRCHSDPATMRRFDPGARVDQEREYRTSHHGRALARGDTRVATCIDCHGAHGILPTDDPAAPVYPTRVAETCAGCHADPARMAGYELADGRPLPVDQHALWRQSVHAAAMLEREDLSAPTCNDCHGNHGAAPPEVESVAQVCGQCHRREAQLFRNSAKSEGFRRHNAFLAEVGAEGCAGCHAEPEPQATVTGVHSLQECVACHRNHAVIRPTVALLAPLPEAPCAFCHEGPAELAAELASEEAAAHYREVRDALLASASKQGLSGDRRFDWLVDQALGLPFHTRPSEADGGVPGLRPEFARLFEKFRIGKTHFTYLDPATGDRVEARVRSCGVCHAAEPLLADAPRGLETARAMVSHMRELTALTASAERTLLRARRGGVSTGEATLEIDRSVDAQVELEALVHGFETGPGSEFASTQAEGLESAREALDAARGALAELASRRRGLAGFLGAVVVVLVSLGLKIRQISLRRSRAALR